MFLCEIVICDYLCKQAYTSQIVVMAMLALAIGGDTISSQARRDAIIDGLFELPSMFIWLISSSCCGFDNPVYARKRHDVKNAYLVISVCSYPRKL